MKLQIKRRLTKEIRLGKLKIGLKNKIAIQTMLVHGLDNPKACIKKINELETTGCDLVRIAVRNSQEIINIKNILKETKLPLVADIQFKWEHAIQAINAGFHGIRINPGYISDVACAKTIIAQAAEKDVAIRLGFNSGSLPKGADSFKGIIKSLEKWLKIFKGENFNNFKISLKSSSTVETIQLNEELTKYTDAPIHLGVTEAGTITTSAIRSGIAFSNLLFKGIGDTIRVSITGDPLQEVIVAKEILRSMGLRNEGVNIISCPTCSRTSSNLLKISNEITLSTAGIKKNITIAIMGCAVNGPGEASKAHFGVAGISKGRFSFFKKGRRVKNIDAGEVVKLILSEIEKHGD